MIRTSSAPDARAAAMIRSELPHRLVPSEAGTDPPCQVPDLVQPLGAMAVKDVGEPAFDLGGRQVALAVDREVVEESSSRGTLDEPVTDPEVTLDIHRSRARDDPQSWQFQRALARVDHEQPTRRIGTCRPGGPVSEDSAGQFVCQDLAPVIAGDHLRARPKPGIDAGREAHDGACLDGLGEARA